MNIGMDHEHEVPGDHDTKVTSVTLKISVASREDLVMLKMMLLPSHIFLAGVASGREIIKSGHPDTLTLVINRMEMATQFSASILKINVDDLPSMADVDNIPEDRRETAAQRVANLAQFDAGNKDSHNPEMLAKLDELAKKVATGNRSAAVADAASLMKKTGAAPGLLPPQQELTNAIESSTALTEDQKREALDRIKRVFAKIALIDALRTAGETVH